jgi:UDP-N-acetylglucosamine/UDP-N-acetylgalactosamine 4-epimerase
MYTTKYHNEDPGKHSFLVTGGAGFIGSHIVEYLHSFGAGSIRILDNLSTGNTENIRRFLDSPNVTFIEGDICDPSVCAHACEGVDFVLHQAALGSVPRSIKDPLNTHNSNVNGFVNMLIAARDAKVRRFIYASSSSVYGDSPILPKSEAVIGKPLSPYAVTKYVDELYAEVFALNYGMEVIGLRYFNIYGPRQNPDGPYAAAIPLFISGVLRNEDVWINGDGEQTRDFTYVENAVQANIRAAFTGNSEACGRVFNIAVGDRTSINELYHTIRELAGSQLQPLYRDERAGDVKHSLADISAAEKHLGYIPEVKLREGIKATFEWFRDNL